MYVYVVNLKLIHFQIVSPMGALAARPESTYVSSFVDMVSVLVAGATAALLVWKTSRESVNFDLRFWLISLTRS